MNISMRVKEIESDKVKTRMQTGVSLVNQALVLSARESIKPLVPFEKGNLRDSANVASRPREGLLIYDTVYAKRQYYALPNKRTPGTINRWGHVGIDRFKPNLIAIAKTEVARILHG